VVALVIAFVGVVGLAMVLAPMRFGEIAHGLRLSVPAPSPTTARIARTTGACMVLAAIVATAIAAQ
jgi:hypothetical protein